MTDLKDLRYEIYSVVDYSKATKQFIDDNALIFNNIEDLSKELEDKDNYYHFRVKKIINIYFSEI